MILRARHEYTDAVFAPLVPMYCRLLASSTHFIINNKRTYAHADACAHARTRSAEEAEEAEEELGGPGPGGCRTALLAVSVFFFAVAAVFFVIGALGESMGVVSECCCKEVYYRYLHNNYYFSLLHLY